MKVRVNKEAAWKGFSSNMEALVQLQTELQNLNTRRADIESQIEAKKRIIEFAAGISWDEIQPTLVSTDSENGAAKKTARRGTKQTPIRAEYTAPQLVLQALANFEDCNPQSRTDEHSIRIFINAHHPEFLSQHNPNVLSNALHALKSKGLVKLAPKRGKGACRFQYCLTAQGRAALD